MSKIKLGRRIKNHIESDRFPYTYAYDFKRNGSRSETGTYLSENFEDINEFAKEILSRAFSYLLDNYATDFLWDILDENDSTDIKDTYNFIRSNYYINMNE